MTEPMQWLPAAVVATAAIHLIGNACTFMGGEHLCLLIATCMHVCRVQPQNHAVDMYPTASMHLPSGYGYVYYTFVTTCVYSR